MILSLLTLVIVTSTSRAANIIFCRNLNPINDFDEETVLGMWYIREYIFHMENTTTTEYNPYCPVIQIRKFEDYVHGGLINRNLVSFIFRNSIQLHNF
jgi:hypothetical protein